MKLQISILRLKHTQIRSNCDLVVNNAVTEEVSKMFCKIFEELGKITKKLEEQHSLLCSKVDGNFID